MTSAFSVEGLSVQYGAATALDNVSCHINSGEVVGLIGPNGAGKTSFIKAVCGRVDAKGVIKIQDKILKRGMDRQNLIGLVPQDIGLYPHMTCLENLEVFARIMGLPSEHRKSGALSALALVDLNDKSGALVNTLSGGMKRRLNVACAIMHAPKLLILDEPTAGTDMPARDSIHRLTRKLAQSGMAVLLVTHELEQVEALCDRVLIFAKGRLLSEGTPSDILETCFGATRELTVRFGTLPTPAMLADLSPFNFIEGELPTMWSALTDERKLSMASAFLATLQNNHPEIREIGIRRPGLPTLMQILEKTGQLP